MRIEPTSYSGPAGSGAGAQNAGFLPVSPDAGTAGRGDRVEVSGAGADLLAADRLLGAARGLPGQGTRGEDAGDDAQAGGGSPGGSAGGVGADGPAGAGKAEKKGKGKSPDGRPNLSKDQEDEVKKLKARDQKVRAHEHAHVAAGGQYVKGGIHYDYQTGPDGRSYAIGGEVQIDTSPVSGDPEATIRKEQTVRRAALAPAQPSAQDRRAAAEASQMEAKAQMDLMKKQTAKTEGKDASNSTNGPQGTAAGAEAKAASGLPASGGTRQGTVSESGLLSRGVPGTRKAQAAFAPGSARFDFSAPDRGQTVDAYA